MAGVLQGGPDEKAVTEGKKHPSHPGGLGVEWDGEAFPCLIRSH